MIFLLFSFLLRTRTYSSYLKWLSISYAHPATHSTTVKVPITSMVDVTLPRARLTAALEAGPHSSFLAMLSHSFEIDPETNTQLENLRQQLEQAYAGHAPLVAAVVEVSTLVAPRDGLVLVNGVRDRFPLLYYACVVLIAPYLMSRMISLTMPSWLLVFPTAQRRRELRPLLYQSQHRNVLHPPEFSPLLLLLLALHPQRPPRHRQAPPAAGPGQRVTRACLRLT